MNGLTILRGLLSDHRVFNKFYKEEKVGYKINIDFLRSFYLFINQPQATFNSRHPVYQ